MRAMTTGVVLVLGARLVACSGTPGPGGVASSGRTTGTVTGVARMYGGPTNQKTGRMALDGTPARGWKIDLRSGQRTVAEITSGEAGDFRFTVAPGRYTLSCSEQTSIDVVAGATVTADCSLVVP